MLVSDKFSGQGVKLDKATFSVAGLWRRDMLGVGQGGVGRVGAGG